MLAACHDVEVVAAPPARCTQDRTEEEEQKPEANYLVAERPTGWHSRCATVCDRDNVQEQMLVPGRRAVGMSRRFALPGVMSLITGVTRSLLVQQCAGYKRLHGFQHASFDKRKCKCCASLSVSTGFLSQEPDAAPWREPKRSAGDVREWR